jgi:hypothetical protein
VLTFTSTAERITVALPAAAPDKIASVVTLDLAGPLGAPAANR